MRVALLTGGGDKPYALGLAASLITQGIAFDFIGSDEVDAPFLHESPLVSFLNLRGGQDRKASLPAKAWRLLRYYVRLLTYAAVARPAIFHILWNNKFEYLDRTIVLLYYKFCRKRIVLTAHNVNIRRRDGNDSFANRFSLKIQYHLADHIFVHTEAMKKELEVDFGVPGRNCTVIPFGLNSTVPNTSLSPAEARRHLGLGPNDQVLLFFGNIAPYKGLEYLVEALAILVKPSHRYRLVIAGRPKGSEEYWAGIRRRIVGAGLLDCVVERIEYIPDEETEIYFKAADVLVLPYLKIFQSGVLFLGYNFGLPVIASDVGALREDIIDNETGFVCRSKDPEDLSRAIEHYFQSDLYRELGSRREKIRRYAERRYSWDRVGEMTRSTYAKVRSA